MLSRRGLLSGLVSLPLAQGALIRSAFGLDPSGTTIVLAQAEFLSAARFGIRGDGVADDTAALQAAWTAAAEQRVNLLIPAGEYRLTETLSGPPILIRGSGQGRTRLVFESMAGRDGLVFRPAPYPNSLAGAEFLSIVAKGTDGRRAIATPRDAGYFGLRPHYQFKHLAFEGSAGITYANPRNGAPSVFSFGQSGWVMDHGWEIYIDLGDSWSPIVANCEVRGTYRPDVDPATQARHVFLRLAASRGIVTARVADVFTHNVWGGIELGDRALLHLDRADIAQSHVGFFTNVAEVGYAEAWIANSAFNAQQTAVHLKGSQGKPKTFVHIINCQAVRDGRGFGAPITWHGFLLEDVGRFFISDCRSESSRSKPAGVTGAIAYRFVGCDWFQASGLSSFGHVSTAFEFDHCSQAVLNRLLIADSAQICFDFRNGTHDLKIGTRIAPRDAGSKAYRFDSTVKQGTILLGE